MQAAWNAAASVQSVLHYPLTSGTLPCAAHTYAQCGGQGGTCTGADCKDAAWSDVACLSYDACTRVNHWWWCAFSLLRSAS